MGPFFVNEYLAEPSLTGSIMKRSKKIFIGVAILFFAFLVGVIYDMSSKTTFPGAKTPKHPTAQDTVKSNLPPKSTSEQQ